MPQTQSEGETPQPEDGFAPIALEILWALKVYAPQLPRPATAWPLLMHVFEQTWGRPDLERIKAGQRFCNKKSFTTTRSELGQHLPFTIRSLNRAIEELHDVHVLVLESAGSWRQQLTLAFNKDYRSWLNFPVDQTYFGTKRSQDQTVSRPNGLKQNGAKQGNSESESTTYGAWDQTVSRPNGPFLGPNGPKLTSNPQENQLSTDPYKYTNKEEQIREPNFFRDHWNQVVAIATEEGYADFGDFELEWFDRYGDKRNLKLCERFVSNDPRAIRYAFIEFRKLRDELRDQNKLQFLPSKLQSVIKRLNSFISAFAVPDEDAPDQTELDRLKAEEASLLDRRKAGEDVSKELKAVRRKFRRELSASR